jgi:hypothetical protein
LQAVFQRQIHLSFDMMHIWIKLANLKCNVLLICQDHTILAIGSLLQSSYCSLQTVHYHDYSSLIHQDALSFRHELHVTLELTVTNMNKGEQEKEFLLCTAKAKTTIILILVILVEDNMDCNLELQKSQWFSNKLFPLQAHFLCMN